MTKKILLIFVSALCLLTRVKADEGLWLPLLIDRLNYVDMQKMGCHLTAEEIYSANHSSLKDAIVSLNDGECTGEIVSQEGLLLTAHHCGMDFVQSHSTTDNDYVKNGFWAMSKIEELRNDKLTATFLISIEDVTSKILPYLNNKITETKRKAIVDSLCAIIEKNATKDTYKAKVESFYNGNEYYLFITETYKDVRLVGAPSESLGEFGGDTDNWMWPRHDADFTFFRVYMSPDGKPASYSKKNVPYKPKHFLPISVKGVKENDFQMILGFPGSTDRFISSFGLKVITDKYCDAIIKSREKRLSIISEDMKNSNEVKMEYSAEYNDISNYYKFYVGVIDQFKKCNTYDKKVELEKTFTNWYNSDPKLKEKYGNVLQELKIKNDLLGKYIFPYVFFDDGALNGIKVIAYANTFIELEEKYKNGACKDTISKITQKLNYAAKQWFKSYNKNTDKKICVEMFKTLFDNIPKEFYPDFYSVIEKKYKGNISAYVDEMYDKSIFADKDKVFEFLSNPDSKKFEKDLGYITMLSIENIDNKIIPLYDKAKLDIVNSNRLFMFGIMEMNKAKKNYPDANSTLRLTYGKVIGFTNPTTKKSSYYTTLDEMIAKDDPKNSEFTIPGKLKELYKTKDFGNYLTNGEMRVCYITDNDCAGGNSGSPVINGDGEITGILFDGNWESIVNDNTYGDNQRSICVDIKFVLFMIDKYAGATNIIKELTLKE